MRRQLPAGLPANNRLSTMIPEQNRLIFMIIFVTISVQYIDIPSTDG
jgi:hypothetical protein